jgi:hypothetical protein
MRALPPGIFLGEARSQLGSLAGAQDPAPPLPPIYLQEAKPRGPLESAKPCEKWPKKVKSEANRSHPKPNLQLAMDQ